MCSTSRARVSILAGGALALVLAPVACDTDAAPAGDDASPPDNGDMKLTSLTPADGETDVAVSTEITAVFDSELAPETIHAGSFYVSDPGGDHIPGSAGASGNTAVFTPSEQLQYATDYEVTLTRAIADHDGAPLRFLSITTFTTERDPEGPPPAPTGLAATLVGDAIDLSWNPAPRAQWHNVYWSVEPGASAATGTRIGPLATSLHFTNVTKDTTFYFVVTGENPSWEGAESAEVSATISGSSPPWTVVTLEGGNVGAHSSIVSYGDGTVAIAYRDAVSANLELATNRSGSWTTTTIDSMADVDSSLRLGSDGRLRALYAGNDGSVRYADDGAGGWSSTTVEPGVSPSDLALALDSAGAAHAAYCVGSDTAPFHVADSAGAAWSTEIAPFSASTFIDVAMDGSGNLHASTAWPELGAPDVTELLHSERVGGGSWTAAPLERIVPLPGAEAPISIDAADTAHFAVHDDWRDIVYLREPAFSSVIASSVDGPVALSLALDTSEVPHVAYQLDDGLYYATLETDSWRIERVDGPGTGADNSIAVDPSGAVHLSYYDETSRSLKYATRAP